MSTLVNSPYIRGFNETIEHGAAQLNPYTEETDKREYSRGAEFALSKITHKVLPPVHRDFRHSILVLDDLRLGIWAHLGYPEQSPVLTTTQMGNAINIAASWMGEIVERDLVFSSDLYPDAKLQAFRAGIEEELATELLGKVKERNQ